MVIYLAHHYSHDVVNALTGDKLYLVDQSIPTRDRTDAAVKQVQKMTPSAGVVIAPPEAKQGKGTARCGGGTSGSGESNARDISPRRAP